MLVKVLAGRRQPHPALAQGDSQGTSARRWAALHPEVPVEDRPAPAGASMTIEGGADCEEGEEPNFNRREDAAHNTVAGDRNREGDRGPRPGGGEAEAGRVGAGGRSGGWWPRA